MTRDTPLLDAIDGPVNAEPKVDIIDDQKYRRLWLSPTIPSRRDIHGPALVALDHHAKGERTKRMISRDKQKNRRKRAKRRKQKNNPKRSITWPIIFNGRRQTANTIPNPLVKGSQQRVISSKKLDDIPDIFTCMAELAASHACRQGIIADTDRVILELIGEIIFALRHRTDKDTHALVGAKALYVIIHAHNRRIKGESDFAAVGREMVCDRVLDDLEQLFLRVCRADGKAM